MTQVPHQENADESSLDLLGLVSFCFIFLSVRYTMQLKIGEEVFPEGAGGNKVMAKCAAAEAALEELKKQGPLPEKVREGLKPQKDYDYREKQESEEKQEALERCYSAVDMRISL